MTESRLVRSDTDRVIAGVCGGLADYLSVDATLVRLAFIILIFASGIGIPIYLVMWFIMPRAQTLGEPNAKILQENLEDMSQTVSNRVNRIGRSGTVGTLFIIFGIYFLLGQMGWLGGFANLFWPLLIIGLGIYLMVNRRS